MSFRYFKKYSDDEAEKVLGKVIYPNNEKPHNVNKLYHSFFQNFNKVINNMAHLKPVRLKNASSEWFEKDVVEILSIRGKLFKKF